MDLIEWEVILSKDPQINGGYVLVKQEKLVDRSEKRKGDENEQ